MADPTKAKMTWPITQQEWIRAQKEVQVLKYELLNCRGKSEKHDDLVKEKDILETLLLSTQQENERCEEELKNWKAYAKNLEKKIETYEGPHWQENPGVPATPVPVKVRKAPTTKIIKLKMPESKLTLTSQVSKPDDDGSSSPDIMMEDSLNDLLSEPASQADVHTERRFKLDPCTELEFKKLEMNKMNKMRRRSATFWEHEEQIVPALANAAKTQERKNAIRIFSETSRRAAKNNSVVDEGDRYALGDTLTVKDDEITRAGIASNNPITESTLQQVSSPADQLQALVPVLETQITTMLARLCDSADRLQETELAQRNSVIGFQTAHLAQQSNLINSQDAAQQSISALNKTIYEREVEWREEADRRERRLQAMLQDAKAQAAVLLASGIAAQF